MHPRKFNLGVFMQALVVDDSHLMRTMLKRAMVKFGFDVAEAGDGLEALTHLNAVHPPDVLLLDWEMPSLTGKQLLSRIRGDSAFGTMKILILMEEAETAHVGDAFELGANDYLVKPFIDETLREKLQIMGCSPSYCTLWPRATWDSGTSTNARPAS